MLPRSYCLFWAIWAVALSSQAEPKDHHHQQSLLLKSTTQLVQVTVIATGPSGAPVTDLTRNDFEVRERGKPQIISTFARNEAQQTGIIDPGFSHLGNFSNSLSSRGSANVLLLDGTETNWKDWKRGWPQVLRFLQGLNSGERIAIYLLDPVHGLEVLQDYDDDPRDLSAKLQNLRNPSLSMLLQSAHEDEVLPPPAFAHRNERLDAPELLGLGRIQGITDAIEAITGHLAGIPGRKSLIWFASRFPDPYRITGNPILQPYRSRLQNALSSLMATDVAIYPVDARGLIPDHSFDAENRGIPSGPLLPRQSPVLPLFDFSTMLELASRSGGKAYFNTNGLEQSVRNAVFAGQCSYTLGFYTSEDPDNRYHSIQILIDRERVHLRYRPGYWAFSNGGSGSSSQAELRVALASPFTAGSIRLQARAVRRPRSPAEVRVTVFIDSSKLAFHKEKNAWSATIDLLFGQKNAAGRVFAIAPYRVPLRVSNKAHVSRVWLSTETVLLLRSQSRSMRIVVRDVNTGAIGSLDIPADKIGLEKQ